ncbi:aminoglycoside adenylyltransferase domain-containing protein [Branchiibius sp. NY16-3462-2]|uniref:aminoglycoside adenylyltransferase domain-containing protein n=1 Tax=Branchiibius sp. NY16-3462-2 TaxID=1807500 RepID=UPI000796335C|nr:aminoglycoside adenylyltransferase domain-containing protein [Branchiibius sp. NY16-3462-2]KYH46204.1 hypothetical protein AZH51_11315 [Branchiibius sp. NY16-3462-2]
MTSTPEPDVRSHPVVTGLVELLNELDPDGVLSVSVVGSAAASGLRPQSDLDVLVITRSSWSQGARRAMIDYLLRVSGARATVTPGRPVELTSLALRDVVPWRYPSTCDFLYGEWLRDDYLAGYVPQPAIDANLPVVVTSARDHALVVRGVPPRQLLDPVPEADLFQSLHDGLPSLQSNFAGDERNVLLTLARMVATLETGRIHPKDVAVEVILGSLDPDDRSTLTLAARGYRGEATDDWSTRADAAAETMRRLVARIEESRFTGSRD